MILLSALAHTGEERAGIGGAINDRHLKRQVTDGHLGLPHALVSPDGLQGQQGLRRFLPGEVFVGGAQGGFHYAAGIAEDHAGTGGLAHQGVVGGVLQRVPVHALCLGPAGQLPGGDDLVGVPHALDAVVIGGSVHLLPPDLKFLGGAGRQGHVDDLPGVQPQLSGKVGFHRGALHTDGALGS